MRKRWTGQEVREFVEGEGYELVEVSNEDWVKREGRIWVSCGEHEPYEVVWNNFKNGKRCAKCANKRRNESNKFSHEKICKRVNELDKNYFICDDSPRYENKTTKLKLSCGKHEYFANWNDFRSGSRCPKCSNLKRTLSQEYVTKKIQELDSKYSICEDSPLYENNITKLKLYHSVCKNEFDVTWNDFKKGNRPCGCYTNSKNEVFLREYLKSRSINFIEQVTFDDLKAKYKLRYDFGIYENDKLLFLIEYDGQQHYSPQRFGGISQEQAEKNFIKQQHHDKLKNDYAKENNIPLLRIRYDEDTISVLENYLKGLQLIKEDDIINLTKEKND